MHGTVKFVDPQTRRWGFIIPDDNGPDVHFSIIALVVTRNPSGSYQGRTVLPLAWAYNNARLVCRPDSDWLEPLVISDGGDQSDTED